MKEGKGDNYKYLITPINKMKGFIEKTAIGAPI